VAGLVCLLEGLVLLGFCVFFLYELVIGEGDDPARVVMSVVLMGIFALMLLLMARAWMRVLPWPRNPTILWNLLMLPVAWSMWGAGFWGALPLGLVALAGITAAFASRAEPTDVTL
jgi:hypothetical protein